MTNKEKTLEEQLESKKKFLNRLEKDLKHYQALYEKENNTTWKGYIASTLSKIMLCKSEILLIQGKIWESNENQPQ